MRQAEALDPPINLIAAAGREHDERLYCSLLTWLLNPSGSHCQGPAFLCALAEQLGMPPVDLALASVYAEVAHQESRIDVEAALRGAFLLHIEAKVYSGEGREQAAREVRDLRAKALLLGVPSGSAAGVFLTRTGESASSSELRPLSWAEVAEVLRPVLARASIHRKVRELAGHVLDCFAALTHGGQMGSFSLNDVDRYLLANQGDVLALLDSWEHLEKRILGQLTEKAWKTAIADEGIPGSWDVYLTKGSGNPMFLREDWYRPDDQWTCIDAGNFTLRGFLSNEPDERAWVGLWWNRLRGAFDDDELAARAKKWIAKMPGDTSGLQTDRGHGIWWRIRLPIAADARSFSDLPRLVVREWGRMAHVFDEVAEMSKAASRRSVRK
jgi:hypothetical protein